MYVAHFVYPSVSEHLGCSYLLATVNNAAMNTQNMGVQMFLEDLAVSPFACMPGSGIAGSLSNAVFHTLTTGAILFSTVTFYIPPNSAQGFQFLHILPSMCYFLFSDDSLPRGCVDFTLFCQSEFKAVL